MQAALDRWGWRLFLGVGALLAALYYIVPPDAGKLIVWPGIGLSSAAALVIGARWHRPASMVAWYLLAAAQFSLTTGDTLYNVRVRILHSGQVFPSVVDLCYLLTYPLLIAGLVLLIRRRSPGRDLPGLIDAAMITIGVGLLSWVFLIAPYVRADLPLFQRLVAVAYPLGDVLVLAVATHLAIGTWRGSTAWWLVAASVVAVLAADSLFVYLQFRGTWHVGGPVDLGWIVFYLCWGAAALHPSMRDLSEPRVPTIRMTTPRIALVGAAALLAPVVLTIQWARGVPVDAGVIAAAAAALFLLAAARIWDLTKLVAMQEERGRIVGRMISVNRTLQARVSEDLHTGHARWLGDFVADVRQARGRMRDGDREDADRLLEDLEKATSARIDEFRRQLSQLRSAALEQLGLVQAIRGLGDSFTSATGVPCTVEADDVLDDQLPLEVSQQLYHLAEDALDNIARHTRATRAGIQLSAHHRRVQLLIHDDDGRYDPRGTRREGLLAMQERVEIMVGGRLDVLDRANGTEVIVELNLEPSS